MEQALQALAAAVAGLGRAALQLPLGARVPLAALGLAVALLAVVAGILALYRRRNSLAASFLNHVLPKAVARLTEEDVSISLLGTFILKNIRLTAEMDNMDLPLLTRQVEIQHLEIQFRPCLPLLWRIQVRVSGVRFHVAERHRPVAKSSQDLDVIQQRQLAALRRYQMRLLDKILFPTAAQESRAWGSSRVGRAVARLLLRALSASLKQSSLSTTDVTLQADFSCESSIHLNNDQAEAEHLGMSSFVVHIDSISTHELDAKAPENGGLPSSLGQQGAQREGPGKCRLAGKALEARGIKLHVCFPRHAGHTPNQMDPGIQVPIIRRWSAEAKFTVSWEPQAGLLLSWDVELGALALATSPPAVLAILDAVSRMSTYLAYKRFQHSRPINSPLVDPGAWWRHAIGCVRRELHSSVQDMVSMREPESPAARLELRRQHYVLYRAYLQRGRTGKPDRRLEDLEAILGRRETAFSRYRVARQLQAQEERAGALGGAGQGPGARAERQQDGPDEDVWWQQQAEVLRDINFLLLFRPHVPSKTALTKMVFKLRCPKVSLSAFHQELLAPVAQHGSELAIHSVTLAYEVSATRQNLQASCGSLLLRNLSRAETDPFANIIQSGTETSPGGGSHFFSIHVATEAAHGPGIANPVRALRLATSVLSIRVAPITVLLDTPWLTRTALSLSPWYLLGAPKAAPTPWGHAGPLHWDRDPSVPDPSSTPACLLPSEPPPGAGEEGEQEHPWQKEYLGIGDQCNALAMRVNGSHLREVKRGERSVGVVFGKFLLLVPCHPLEESTAEEDDTRPLAGEPSGASAASGGAGTSPLHFSGRGAYAFRRGISEEHIAAPAVEELAPTLLVLQVDGLRFISDKKAAAAAHTGQEPACLVDTQANDMEGGFQTAYLGHHTEWISAQQLGRLAPLEVELLYICLSVHLFLAQPSVRNLHDFRREVAIMQQGTVRASVAFCRNPISLTATGLLSVIATVSTLVFHSSPLVVIELASLYNLLKSAYDALEPVVHHRLQRGTAQGPGSGGGAAGEGHPGGGDAQDAHSDAHSVGVSESQGEARIDQGAPSRRRSGGRAEERLGVYQKRLEWTVLLKSGGVAWITSLLKHQYEEARPSVNTGAPGDSPHTAWSFLAKPESQGGLQQPLLPRREGLEGRGEGKRAPGGGGRGRAGGRGNTLFSKIGMQYKDGAGDIPGMLVDAQVDKSLIVSRMGLDRIMLEGERTARHMSLSLHCRNMIAAKLMPAGIYYRPVPRPPSVTVEAIFYSWLLRTLIGRRRQDEGSTRARGGELSIRGARNRGAPLGAGASASAKAGALRSLVAEFGAAEVAEGSSRRGGGATGSQGGSTSSRRRRKDTLSVAQVVQKLLRAKAQVAVSLELQGAETRVSAKLRYVPVLLDVEGLLAGTQLMQKLAGMVRTHTHESQRPRAAAGSWAAPAASPEKGLSPMRPPGPASLASLRDPSRAALGVPRNAAPRRQARTSPIAARRGANRSPNTPRSSSQPPPPHAPLPKFSSEPGGGEYDPYSTGPRPQPQWPASPNLGGGEEGQGQGEGERYSEAGSGGGGDARDVRGYLKLGKLKKNESNESASSGTTAGTPLLGGETPRYQLGAGDSVLDGTQIDILGPHSEWHPPPSGRADPSAVYTGPKKKSAEAEGEGGEKGGGKKGARTLLRVSVDLLCGVVEFGVKGNNFGQLVLSDCKTRVEAESQSGSWKVRTSVRDMELIDLKATSPLHRYIVSPTGDLSSLGVVVRSSQVERQKGLILPQVQVYVETQQLRICAINRFIMDSLFFANRLLSIHRPTPDPSLPTPRGSAAPGPPKGATGPGAGAGEGTGAGAGSGAGAGARQGVETLKAYQTLVFVLVDQLKITVPRTSWESEALDVHVSSLGLMIPGAPKAENAISVVQSLTTKVRHNDVSFWAPYAHLPGSLVTLAAHLADFKIHWAIYESIPEHHRETHMYCPAEPSVSREVLSGGDVGLLLQTAPRTRLRVVWPQFYLVFGEIQMSLLMGILAGNLAEGSSYVPSDMHPSIVGLPLGGAQSPPQPGVDLRGALPLWELQFDVGSAVARMEAAPATLPLTGYGEPLCSLRLASTLVAVLGFPHFLQVCVKAERLVLTDDRFQNLTEQQVTLLEAPRPQFLAQQEQARGMGAEGGAGDWRGGGWGGEQAGGATGGGRQLAERNALRLTVVLKEDQTTVVQVILRKAGLMWPYMLDLGLIWRITDAMTRFVLRPWCATGPPSALNDAWTFVNVILHDFELMLPVSSGSFFTDGPSTGPEMSSGTTRSQSRGESRADRGGVGGWGEQSSGRRDPEGAQFAELPALGAQGQVDVSEGVFVREFGVWSEDLDEVIAELPATGLRLRARTLRAGWFCGGDNESHLLLDFINTSAGCVNSATRFETRDFLSPHTSQLAMRIKNSKRFYTTSTAVKLTVSPTLHASDGRLPINFVFSHIVVLASFIRKLKERTAASAGDLFNQRLHVDGERIPVPFIPTAVLYDARIHDLCLALVDDRISTSTTVLELRASDVELRKSFREPLESAPSSTSAKLTATLSCLYLNSDVELLESLVDPWSMVLEAKDKAGRWNISGEARQTLEVTFSPAALRSLGDTLTFSKLLYESLHPAGTLPEQAQCTGRLTRAPTFPRDQSLVDVETKLEESAEAMVGYRIINLTGLPLMYWAENGECKTAAHVVGPDEEQVLQVVPVQKVVTLKDTRQIQARTISLRLQGEWLHITDIVVDKVGKYVMDLVAPSVLEEDVVVPLIFDVSLDVRTKVVTVHSTIQLWNATDLSLAFEALLLAPTRGSVSSSRYAKYTIGPLKPDEHVYMPVRVALGGQLIALAEGFGKAEKDKVDLARGNLRDQQGLIEFPPSGSVGPSRGPPAEGEGEGEGEGEVGQWGSSTKRTRSAYCCLHVAINEATQLASVGATNEFRLMFLPPVELENTLPYPLEAVVWDVEAGSRHVLFLAPGECKDLYDVSLDHNLELILTLQGVGGVDYKGKKRSAINFCPNDLLGGNFRGYSWAYDANNLRLAKHCTLQAQAPYGASSASAAAPSDPADLEGAGTGGAGQNFIGQGPSMRLYLSNRSNWQSRSRRIVVYSRLWVINKTGMRIFLLTGEKKHNVVCKPYQEGRPTLLWMRKTSTTAISVDGTQWSPDINVVSVGVKGACAVKAEVMLQRDASAVDVDETGQALSYSSKPRKATRRYEFGVEVMLAPRLYEGSKVVVISPRYVLSNQTGVDIELMQTGSKRLRQLGPGVQTPFHWDDDRLEKLLEVRLVTEYGSDFCASEWSGKFRVDNAGEQSIRVWNNNSERFEIVSIDISLNNASALVTFDLCGPGRKSPQYRIENRSSAVTVKYKQQDADHLQLLKPNTSAPFAWDEPFMPQKLEVLVEGYEVPPRLYALEDIKTHAPIQLLPTPRPGAATAPPSVGDSSAAYVSNLISIANTGGRKALSQLRGASGHLSMESREGPPSLGGTRVPVLYVNLYADGSTRVLSFSDTESQNSKLAEEEERDRLEMEMESIQERTEYIRSLLCHRLTPEEPLLKRINSSRIVLPLPHANGDHAKVEGTVEDVAATLLAAQSGEGSAAGVKKQVARSQSMRGHGGLGRLSAIDEEESVPRQGSAVHEKEQEAQEGGPGQGEGSEHAGEEGGEGEEEGNGEEGGDQNSGVVEGEEEMEGEGERDGEGGAMGVEAEEEGLRAVYRPEESVQRKLWASSSLRATYRPSPSLADSLGTGSYRATHSSGAVTLTGAGGGAMGSRGGVYREFTGRDRGGQGLDEGEDFSSHPDTLDTARSAALSGAAVDRAAASEGEEQPGMRTRGGPAADGNTGIAAARTDGGGRASMEWGAAAAGSAPASAARAGRVTARPADRYLLVPSAPEFAALAEAGEEAEREGARGRGVGGLMRSATVHVVRWGEDVTQAVVDPRGQWQQGLRRELQSGAEQLLRPRRRSVVDGWDEASAPAATTETILPLPDEGAYPGLLRAASLAGRRVLPEDPLGQAVQQGMEISEDIGQLVGQTVQSATTSAYRATGEALTTALAPVEDAMGRRLWVGGGGLGLGLERGSDREGAEAVVDADATSVGQSRMVLQGEELREAGGGDLTVTLICATDIAANPQSCNPFVELQLGSDVRRSSVKYSTVHPHWEERFIFHQVSAQSTLKLSILGHDILAPPRFLGQVVLPLLDEEESQRAAGGMASLEPRWFPLGRRTPRDSVRGYLELSWTWDATELELKSLKLDQMKMELEVLEEMVAQERELVGMEGLKEASARARQRNQEDRKRDSERAAGQGQGQGQGGALGVPRSPVLCATDADAGRAGTGAAGGVTPPQGFGTPKDRLALAALTASYSSGIQSASILGKLKVKLVEAKHLAIPAEWMRRVWSLDAFAVLSIRRRAEEPRGAAGAGFAESRAVQRRESRRVGGSFFPQWNQSFEFDDVPLSADLELRLLNWLPFGQSLVLGEGSISVGELKDGLPQYVWVQLDAPSEPAEAPQGAAGGRAGNSPGPGQKARQFVRLHALPGGGEAGAAARSRGSVRLRLQWNINDLERQEQNRTLSIGVRLAGVWVTLVDRMPRELLLVSLQGLQWQWVRTSKDVRSCLEVANLRIDNQLLTAQNPLVLLRYEGWGADLGAGSGAGQDGRGEGDALTRRGGGSSVRPLLMVKWCRLVHSRGVLHFKEFEFALQQFDLRLEEDLVDTVAAYYMDIPWADLWQPMEPTAEVEKSGRMSDPYQLQKLIEPQLVTGKQGERWYFERFAIEPMRVNVTLAMNSVGRDDPLGQALSQTFSFTSSDAAPAGRSGSRSASRRGDSERRGGGRLGTTRALEGPFQLRKFAASTGFPLVSITRAAIRLNALILESAFQSSDTMLSSVGRHYLTQILSEVHKILGSVEILGSPASLVENLAMGVYVFYAEPAKASTPEEFLAGVGVGTLSFAKHSAYGVLNSVSSLTAGLGMTVARLSLDDNYIQRYSQRPQTAQQQLVRGAQDLGTGLFEGITGVVVAPVEGAQRAGAAGAASGVARGMLGVVAKPVSGVLGLASKVTGSMATGIRATGEDWHLHAATRLREPRNFGQGEVVELNPVDSARLQPVLNVLSQGRFASEHIVDFLQVLPNKAILFTTARMLHYSSTREFLLWEVLYKEVQSITGMEGRLEVVVLHARPLRVGQRSLHFDIPHRKVIRCSTRDLHMALLVKLNRHCSHFMQAAQGAAASDTSEASSLDGAERGERGAGERGDAGTGAGDRDGAEGQGPKGAVQTTEKGQGRGPHVGRRQRMLGIKNWIHDIEFRSPLHLRLPPVPEVDARSSTGPSLDPQHGASEADNGAPAGRAGDRGAGVGLELGAPSAHPERDSSTGPASRASSEGTKARSEAGREAAGGVGEHAGTGTQGQGQVGPLLRQLRGQMEAVAATCALDVEDPQPVLLSVDLLCQGALALGAEIGAKRGGGAQGGREREIAALVRTQQAVVKAALQSQGATSVEKKGSLRTTGELAKQGCRILDREIGSL